MKATLKQIEYYNERYGANCTLYEIEISTYKLHGEHLTQKDRYELMWQTNDYKEALEYYKKEKWAHDNIREVFLRRAHWDKRRDEPYYMTMFEYRSPRLKWLLKNDYYVIHY